MIKRLEITPKSDLMWCRYVILSIEKDITRYIGFGSSLPEAIKELDRLIKDVRRGRIVLRRTSQVRLTREFKTQEP